MKAGGLPFNWFDLVVFVVLAVGVYRGRQRGLSEELLDVMQWLTIVVVAALFYLPVGGAAAANISLSLLVAYVAAYLCIAICVKMVFGWFRRSVGDKLVGSDLFGRAEYYLGMAAGALRFSCVLLAVLAVLHARHFSAEILAAQARAQKDNFGDISFPTLSSIQNDVFINSLSGQFIRRHLREQLIVATPSGRRLVERDTLRSQRERELDDVVGARR